MKHFAPDDDRSFATIIDSALLTDLFSKSRMQFANLRYDNIDDFLL